MGNNSNVIDMTARRKAQLENGVEVVNGSAEIVDLSFQRQEILKQERRTNRRTVVSEGFGGFIVVPQKGLLEVCLFDIQPNGISFDIVDSPVHFDPGDLVALRIYINQTHYFPIEVTIRHATPHDDEGVIRHGAEFAAVEGGTEAIKLFVKFVEAVSPFLRVDDGDFKIPVNAR